MNKSTLIFIFTLTFCVSYFLCYGVLVTFREETVIKADKITASPTITETWDCVFEGQDCTIKYQVPGESTLGKCQFKVAESICKNKLP